MRFANLAPSLFVLSAFAAPAAQAQLTFYTTRASFDAACPGLTIENWENARISNDAASGEHGPIDKNTNDAIFHPGDIQDGIRVDSNPHQANGNGLAVTGNGFDGTDTKKIFGNLFGDKLDIFFYNNNSTCVGMDVSSVDVSRVGSGTVDFNVYGTSGLIGTSSVLAGAPGVFIGVQNTAGVITRINLSPRAVQVAGVDNVAFGRTASVAVPEPGSLALLAGMTVTGAGFFLRRRKTRANALKTKA